VIIIVPILVVCCSLRIAIISILRIVSLLCLVDLRNI